MKILISSFLFLFTALYSFSQSTSKIECFAPAYIGETVKIYTQDDFITNKLRLLKSVVVEPDSIFRTTIELDKTQQVFLKSKNNKGFFIVEPGSNYQLLFPDKDKYAPNRPMGNDVEIRFFNLDTNDINYKIIQFQFETDNFLGEIFHLKNAKPIAFANAIDSFKTVTEKNFINDSSIYFKTYVRFKFAEMDNIQSISERNIYEKYDFYLKKFPVSYYNEPYMEYVKSFYKNYVHRINNTVNQKTYEGVIKASPTVIMHALGQEYTMSNLRLRELVMLLILKDEYISGEYPETNVMTILDSLSNKSLFKEHEIIAKNLKFRLTELTPGAKAPEFALKNDQGEMKTLRSYATKHLYIHFYDPGSINNQKEIPLLLELYEKYNDFVQFITVYRNSDTVPSEISQLPWDTFNTKQSEDILENYNIQSFPYYTFIDQHGYIIASPSLTPTPNGQYDTIDRVFFELKKEILRRQQR